MRRFAEEQLKKDLETADGVAAVKVTGGHEEEIQVDLDEGKLSEFGITIQEVGQRLAQDNQRLHGNLDLTPLLILSYRWFLKKRPWHEGW